MKSNNCKTTDPSCKTWRNLGILHQTIQCAQTYKTGKNGKHNIPSVCSNPVRSTTHTGMPRTSVTDAHRMPDMTPYSTAIPYAASSTASSHSLEVSVPGTSTAKCENQLSGAAPCQCFTPAGILTTSPGSNRRARSPQA